MGNTQNVLVAVIFALVVVIGLLVFDRTHHPETLGEKVGRGIDQATQNLGDAIDQGTRHK